MKDETYKAITDLKFAKIKTVMATGDHGLTAISVAKKCRIIDSKLPCYFGDLMKDNNQTFMVWTLIDHSKERLAIEESKH
jgi:cation-transporting P-type ATPase 13A2